MRTFYLLLFFFGFFGPFVQGQESENDLVYRAAYTLSYQPNRSDEASRTSEIMYLFLGEEKSRFLSKGKFAQDSLRAKVSSEGLNALGNMQKKIADNKTAFDYAIHKDMQDGKLLYRESILMDHLQYEEELTLFDWKILPESRSIKGYRSQKATTSFAGRDYTAWFTSEIPIPDGPYKFNGLPGLILQVSDSQKHYVFELTEFKQLKEPGAIGSEEKFITTTKEKLFKVKEEYERDPFAAVENANSAERTVTIEIDENTKRKMLKKRREELAKKNNPIELK